MLHFDFERAVLYAATLYSHALTGEPHGPSPARQGIIVLMTLSAEDRARRIKILLFDVDGVLTDGQLYFLPKDGGQPGPTASCTAWSSRDSPRTTASASISRAWAACASASSPSASPPPSPSAPATFAWSSSTRASRTR